MSGYLEGVLVVLAINVILAYAASLPLSVGQLNLGVAGFMAIGAYGSAWLTNELMWPIFPALVCGGLAAGLVALIVGVPIMRTHGIYMALATFALGEIIKAVFLNLDVVGGASGYPVFAYLESEYVWLSAGFVFLLMVYLAQTRFLLYLTAIKNDATVTDLFGVNVHALRLGALALGATLAGVGGGVYAHQFSYVEAQYFSALLNIYIVLYVLFGGVQTVYGPLIGAAFFTFLPEALRFSDEWRFVFFAAFIIAFMALRPEGVVTSSLLRGIRSLFKRGKAEA